jgi:hypothetical protein
LITVLIAVRTTLMSSYPHHHGVAVHQSYHQPSSSTANFPDVHMQDATEPTRFGFFTGASNTDASGGVFTDIGGDPFKTALANTVRSNPNMKNHGLTFQLEKFLVQPVKETRISCTILMDALDECEDKEPVLGYLD